MSGYILLVEDDENIQQFISTVLSREGYQVLTASNGAAALQLTAQREPGLILLDMHMPTMDGSAFLTIYRTLAKLPTPVVIVTVDHLSLSSQVRAAVEHILIKPFGVEELLNCVEKYMVRNQA